MWNRVFKLIDIMYTDRALYLMSDAISKFVYWTAALTSNNVGNKKRERETDINGRQNAIFVNNDMPSFSIHFESNKFQIHE